MYKRILIAVDDSATSNFALEEAIQLARDQHAALNIVHVVDQVALQGAAPIANAAESEKTWSAIGQDILQRAQDAARKAGVNADTGLLETQNVEDRLARAILHEAKRLHADLLVAGTHGRSGLKHLLMGSVAEGIVRHSHIPVMLVRNARREP